MLSRAPALSPGAHLSQVPSETDLEIALFSGEVGIPEAWLGGGQCSCLSILDPPHPDGTTWLMEKPRRGVKIRTEASCFLRIRASEPGSQFSYFRNGDVAMT